MEEFRPVNGFEGLYEVSNIGRLYSLNYDGTGMRKEIKCGRNKDGYRQCMLYQDGCKYGKKLHRIVAEAFIPNPLQLPQVNHLDENKDNNSVENLEWCSIKQNANHGTRNQRIAEKLSIINQKPVESIDKYGHVTRYDSATKAALETKAGQANITACCKCRRNSAGGLRWRYAEN